MSPDADLNERTCSGHLYRRGTISPWKEFNLGGKTVDLSIVVPVYYSAETLIELSVRLKSAASSSALDCELIFVDDGSPDNSWEIILKLAAHNSWVHGVRLRRNYGQHKAIMAGLELAKGEWIVVMDADLQDCPEAISELLRAARSSETDAVIALRGSEKNNFVNRTTSAIFHKFLKRQTGIETRAKTGNFGAYSRELIDTVVKFRDQEFIFPALIAWCHPKPLFIEVVRDARATGASAYSFKKRLNLATQAFIWNTNGALKVALGLGAVSSAIGVGAALWLIYDRLAGDSKIPGWTSIVVTILFSNGLILSAIGVLGLYVGKIFDSSKDRPRFLVQGVTQGLSQRKKD